MKNMLKNTMIVSALCLAVGMLAACSEWTEPESNGIKRPSFPNDNPELYVRYLAALRDYKAAEHPIAFGWFDNSEKAPMSRAQHPASVPDSMDIVSLLHPDNLADWEIGEMSELREKGTKVIFTFSYADILAAYEATLPPAQAEEGGDEPAADGFLAYLTQQADYYLGLVTKYDYDGVSVFYEPLPLEYLQPAEKAREEARQQTFAAELKAWRKVHAGKLFLFEGQPQNLADKSLLDECDYIVVRAFGATSFTQLNLQVRAASVDGVPVDRFVAGVQALPLDASDLTTGRFADASGEMTLSAVTEAAKWVASPEGGMRMAGLGICNVQNDYYNTTLIYKNIREAISTLNPSPKN